MATQNPNGTISERAAYWREGCFYDQGMALYLAVLMHVAARSTPERPFKDSEPMLERIMPDFRLRNPNSDIGCGMLRPGFEWGFPF